MKKRVLIIVGIVTILLIIGIAGGYFYYKYFYPYSGNAPAISERDLFCGAYYGDYNQKKPGTPDNWRWSYAGRSSGWYNPNNPNRNPMCEYESVQECCEECIKGVSQAPSGDFREQSCTGVYAGEYGYGIPKECKSILANLTFGECAKVLGMTECVIPQSIEGPQKCCDNLNLPHVECEGRWEIKDNQCYWKCGTNKLDTKEKAREFILNLINKNENFSYFGNCEFQIIERNESKVGWAEGYRWNALSNCSCSVVFSENGTLLRDYPDCAVH